MQGSNLAKLDRNIKDELERKPDHKNNRYHDLIMKILCFQILNPLPHQKKNNFPLRFTVIYPE